jgi:hypothetical protein
MAKVGDEELYREIRSRGVRKKVARQVASSLTSRSGDENPKAARRAIADLSSAVSEIESRMSMDEGRRVAGKKAAKTRRKAARRRSKTAKRAAGSRVRA